MKARKLIFLLVVLLLLIVVSTVSAHGNDSDRLSNAGWNCIVAGPNNWIHCFAPGQSMARGQAGNVMVFGGDGHPFLGTELLIHEDVYNGQPCAADNGEPYHFLVDPPFYACHHFETPH